MGGRQQHAIGLGQHQNSSKRDAVSSERDDLIIKSIWGHTCSSPVVRGPEHMHAAALKGGVLNICMQQP